MMMSGLYTCACASLIHRCIITSFFPLFFFFFPPYLVLSFSGLNFQIMFPCSNNCSYLGFDILMGSSDVGPKEYR
jgi:hypothetical protein